MIHGFKALRKPNIASIPALEANQRFITERILRRSIISARAPAGMVNRKKGREATVDISEIMNGELETVCIIQVAAVSCADTPQPEMTVAIQSRRKVRFRSEIQMELLLIR